MPGGYEVLNGREWVLIVMALPGRSIPLQLGGSYEPTTPVKQQIVAMAGDGVGFQLKLLDQLLILSSGRILLKQLVPSPPLIWTIATCSVCGYL